MADIEMTITAVNDTEAATKEVTENMDKVKKSEEDVTKEGEKTKKQNVSLKGSWTELSAQMNVVENVANKVVAAWKNLSDEYLVNINRVRDLTRLTGNTPEAMSRVKEVADDLGISFEELSTAMEAATRKGVDVSTDGLAKLSEEYLKLAPGLEQSKFLMDNFGRSGARMAYLMEKGPATIRDMSNAIADNLIVTQKAIDAGRKYEIAIDDLSDSLTGVKYEMAEGAIPTLTKFLNVVKKSSEITDDQNAKWTRSIPIIGGVYEAYTLVKGGIEATKEANDKNIPVTDAATSSYRAMARAVEENKAALDGLPPLVDATTDGFVRVGDEAAIAAGKINSMTAGLEGFGKMQAFLIAAEGLNDKAQFQLALNMGLIDDKAVALQVGMDKLTEKYDKNKDGVLEAAEKTAEYLAEVLALSAAFDNFNDKTVTLTVNMPSDGSGYGYNPYTGSTGAGGYGYNPYTPVPHGSGSNHGAVDAGFANGIDNFIVPPGYPNDSYRVGLTSGEHVNVSPDGSGGGVNIGTVNINNGIDFEEFKYEIKQSLRR